MAKVQALSWTRDQYQMQISPMRFRNSKIVCGLPGCRTLSKLTTFNFYTQAQVVLKQTREYDRDSDVILSMKDLLTTGFRPDLVVLLLGNCQAKQPKGPWWLNRLSMVPLPLGLVPCCPAMDFFVEPLFQLRRQPQGSGCATAMNDRVLVIIYFRLPLLCLAQ